LLNAGRGHVIYLLGLYKFIANAVCATPYAQSKVAKANCSKHIEKGLMDEAQCSKPLTESKQPKGGCMLTNQSGLGFISLIEVMGLPTY